jgi:hypothetical protein
VLTKPYSVLWLGSGRAFLLRAVDKLDIAGSRGAKRFAFTTVLDIVDVVTTTAETKRLCRHLVITSATTKRFS